jgi:hypothetical protein
MEDTNKTIIPTTLNDALQPQTNRLQSLIDILYLTNVIWLYVFSLIYPLFGIIFGIILSAGGISKPTKKVGRICIILGVVNIILFILVLIVLILAGNLFSRFNPYTL